MHDISFNNHNKVDLSKYNNQWYTPANKIKILCWFFINGIFFRNPLNPSIALKIRLLRLFGAKIGKNVIIKPAVNIKYPWLLSVGNNVWIGENVWIDNLSQIIINDNVCLSQESMLLCGNHDYKKTTFDLIIKEIVLEEGCWIGAKSIVCPGVICKSHSILTAGSVATINLQPYSIYQGNPAKKIREREIY